jgi:hypothetical protein|nr:hypothetical protein [Streptomyces luteolifulvus]
MSAAVSALLPVRAVAADQGAGCRVGLDASALAAGAQFAIGVDRDVAELPGSAGPASCQTAVADDARGQAGAEHDHEQVAQAGAEPVLPLGQAGGPDIVLEGDGQAYGVGGSCGQGCVAQAEVRCEADDPGVGVDQPGSATADGPDTRADEDGGRLDDRSSDGVGPLRDRGGQP